MRILVFGRSGQLGSALLRSLRPCGLVIPAGRESADLESPKEIRRLLRNVQPDVIVNAAAYTDVDRAEAEPKIVRAVNGVAPRVMAEEALRSQSVFIHFSTNYVFDGSKREPYSEHDKPAPLNVFGTSKLEGEQGVEDVGGAYLILRTGWVFANHGVNFLTKVLQRAQQSKEVTVASDQVGVPTSASDLAVTTREILQALEHDSMRRGMRLYVTARRMSGVYNAVAGGHGTLFDFATAIVESARRGPLSQGLRIERLLPVGSHELPTKARRPAYSVLSRKKLLTVFGLEMPHWRAGLDRSLQALADA